MAIHFNFPLRTYSTVLSGIIIIIIMYIYIYIYILYMYVNRYEKRYISDNYKFCTVLHFS